MSAVAMSVYRKQEKNKMSEYEEELLEQRAQEWDDVDDAQEM